MVELVKKRKIKSDGRVVVNVSFTELEYNLLNFADEHGNFSQYVKRLIREDMENRMKETNNITMSPEILKTLMSMMNSGVPVNIPQVQEIKPEAVPEVPKPTADKAKVNNLLKNLKTK